MTRPTITREALRAAVALASAQVFDIDIPLDELLDGVPPEDAAQALAFTFGVVLDVLARKHLLRTIGAVAARTEAAGP
ncbi:hypothetical protein ACFOSC_26585 [Streptantibioticus rubrisoli]|uniref:Uncharacterized protein n=1 Tax=Streptantibioticus rubrisoli TaxID=1387313 RepID=A0ABT1PEQ4_9ACTN|nr:hypothetical protein [Streptantibioticus rubrisoli]MCQ4043857.1 hypothetical protein [Streptantibioticus rubrisoli]